MSALPFPPKGCGITHDEWLAMRARYREVFVTAKQRAIDEYCKARERDGVALRVVSGIGSMMFSSVGGDEEIGKVAGIVDASE